MNHHNMLLIVELLIIMLDLFVLGLVWLGFYILVIVYFWSMLQLIQL